jgi:heat shock transcription factor
MPYDPAAFHTDYTGAFSLLPSSGDGDLAPFEAHDEHLQKTYSSAHEISEDVDELQTNIHSLLHGLGFDPTTFDTGNAQVSLDDTYGSGLGSGQDSFDFGSYLNGLDLPSGGVDGHAGQVEEDPDMESLRLVDKLDSARAAGVETKMPTEQVHAFLDEVASQDSSMDVAASLMQTNQGANATRGRKRKSDAVDVGSFSGAPEAASSTPTSSAAMTGNRSKRKR